MHEGEEGQRRVGLGPQHPLQPLRGQRGQSWVPGENRAHCLNNSAHEPPVETDEETGYHCGCGFWAYWAPPERPHFSQSQLWLLGVIKDATGSYPMGLLPLAAISAVGCLLVLTIGRGRDRFVADKANAEKLSASTSI